MPWGVADKRSLRDLFDQAELPSYPTLSRVSRSQKFAYCISLDLLDWVQGWLQSAFILDKSYLALTGRSPLITMTGSMGDRKNAMAATGAMTVSAKQHKGWTWTWTRTPVFSYKVPTTRSTDCLSLFFLSPPVYNCSRKICILCSLSDRSTYQQ